MTQVTRGELKELDTVRRFVTAGNATFTIVSKKTGKRYTYKMEGKKDDEGNFSGDLWFVKLLTGPDNEGDFTRIGVVVLDDGKYSYRKKGGYGTAPTKGLLWFFKCINQGQWPRFSEQAEFWHEARCGRCGRKLTVPESVESGLGPICAGRAG
jgi:hypothetical protein